MGTALHKRLSKPKSLSRSQTRLWQGRTRRDRAGPIAPGRRHPSGCGAQHRAGFLPHTAHFHHRQLAETNPDPPPPPRGSDGAKSKERSPGGPGQPCPPPRSPCRPPGRGTSPRGASRALRATKPPPGPRPGPGAPRGLRPRQGPQAPSTAAPRDLPRGGPRRLRAARRAAAAPPRALPLRPAAPRPYPA